MISETDLKMGRREALKWIAGGVLLSGGVVDGVQNYVELANTSREVVEQMTREGHKWPTKEERKNAAGVLSLTSTEWKLENSHEVAEAWRTIAKSASERREFEKRADERAPSTLRLIADWGASINSIACLYSASEDRSWRRYVSVIRK